MKSINILDKDYSGWLKELSSRYRQSQIKAAVKVNQEMLRFYWELGRDIVEMHIEERWGEGVIHQLSIDMKNIITGAKGFTERNIYYCKSFYTLYNQYVINLPQVGAEFAQQDLPQVVAQIDVKQETNTFWQNPVHSLSAFPNMNWRNSIRRR